MQKTDLFRHPRVYPSTLDGINKAIECINQGGVVILPADTVYGLFSRADMFAVVERVYQIKQRERRKPFVIYTNKEKVNRLIHINNTARILIEKVWPQALSLILPKKDIIPDWFTQNLPTVAVMTAKNPVVSRVTYGVDAPILGTTVNISGEPEMKTAAEVFDFVDQIDVLIADDTIPVYNKSSTMIDCTVVPPKIVRLSSLSLEYLQTIIPEIEIELTRRIA